MRRFAALVIALAWLAPEPAVGAARCAPGTPKVLRSNAGLVVFEDAREVIRVCDRLTGRTRAINTGEDADLYDDGIYVEVFAVTPRFVAYHAFVSERDRSHVQMRVLDARRGRLVVDELAFTGAYSMSPQQTTHGVRRAVAGETGAVAWITERYVGDPVREVWWAQPGEPAELLDSGTAIDTGPLLLGRASVHWVDGGERRAARVPAAPATLEAGLVRVARHPRGRSTARWLPSGRVTRLDPRAGRFAVAGRYLAYSSILTSMSGYTRLLVRVLDVRTGRHVIASGAFLGTGGRNGPAGRVLATAVSSRGDVAWITETPDGVAKVHMRRRTGRAEPDPEPVDAGPGVDPQSLAIDRAGAAWMRDGRAVYRASDVRAASSR